MNDKISLTVPSTKVYLAAAAVFFNTLAESVEPAVTPAPVEPAVTPAPVEPAVTPAPVEPAVPPAPIEPAPGVELDAAGLPWDARIHAGTKTKTVDRCWKKKRGVDAAVLQQVEAELKAAMAATPPTDNADTAAQDAFGATETTTATACPATFPEFNLLITKALGENRITQDQLLEAIQRNGLDSYQTLAVRFDLAPSVLATLGI